MNDFRTFIEHITHDLLHYLPIILPLSFIGIKIILIRLSGHKEDQWRAILAVPEDVSYGALAFVIAGLTGDIGGFHKYFAESPNPFPADVWTLFGLNLAVCYAIHLAHQYLVLPQYEGWRAADALIIEENEKTRQNKAAIRGYKTVYVARGAALIVLLTAEVIAAGWWLSYVAEMVETQ
jgi:hypothetical protein